MSTVLIVYATTEGQTGRIATHLADVAHELGHVVSLQSVDHLLPTQRLDEYDLVVIGSPIHFGRHDRRLVRWIQRHRDGLARVESVFFSVSATARDTDLDATQQIGRYLQEFEERTGWQPDHVATFAGAMPYTEFGWLKRRFARNLVGGDEDTTADVEYTDWARVDRFAHDLFARVPART